MPDGDTATSTPISEPCDSHTYFGLTTPATSCYTGCSCSPCPKDRQVPFVAMLENLDQAFADVDSQRPTSFKTGRSDDIGALTPEQRHAISVNEGDENIDPPVCFDEDGCQLRMTRSSSRSPDPVPHYNRGRTYIAPKPVIQ